MGNDRSVKLEYCTAITPRRACPLNAVLFMYRQGIVGKVPKLVLCEVWDSSLILRVGARNG